MDNKDLRLAMSEIKETAILNAYAVVAVLGMKEDDISENEAKRIYGRGWIKSRTEVGLLHFSRNGSSIVSTKMYSRFEIEALKRAEKHIAEQYKQAADSLIDLETETNNDHK